MKGRSTVMLRCRQSTEALRIERRGAQRCAEALRQAYNCSKRRPGDLYRVLGTDGRHSRTLRAACWSAIVVMPVHVDLLRDTARWPAPCSNKPSTYVLFAASDVLVSPTGGASLILCGLQLRPRPGFAAFVECLPGAAVSSFSTVIDGRGSCGERWGARCLVHELVVMCSSALRRTAVGQPVALLAVRAIVTPVVMEVSS